jgi:FSR family fosmidomycin resistance protein-like MFS transporter
MTAVPVKLKKLFGLNRKNVVVWGVSIGHGFTHWYPSTFYLLLPLLKNEMGLSYTEMGFLITFRFLIGTLCNLPSGVVSDLVGRYRLLLALSLSLAGVPYFFVGLSNSYYMLLFCMGLIGLGTNLWHPPAISMLRDVYPSKRGWAIGWHASAANIGDALGPFLSGILLAWITWRQILVSSSLAGLAMGLFIWWLLGSSGRKSENGSSEGGIPMDRVVKERQNTREYLRRFGRLIVDPDIFLLSLINGIRSLTQNGLSTFLPSFFMNVLNLSPGLSGVYLTVLQVAGIFASPISGHLSDHYGRKKIVTTALAATSIAVFSLAFLNITWLFVVFLGVLGFFLYSLRPVLLAWTMEVAPKELGGSAIGVQFSFQSALSALSPVLGGWIADKWGLMYTFYFLAATLVLSNLLVVLIREPQGTEEIQEEAA